MQIAAALSSIEPPSRLAEHLAMQLESLHTHPADLITLFVSQQIQPSFYEVMAHIRTAMRPRHLLAVTAESVIGNDQELERIPAASALVMHLPGVEVDTFHIAEDEWPEMLNDDDRLRQRIDRPNLRGIILLAEPYTTPIVQFLDACARILPHAPVIGGMASGMTQAGEARLAADDFVHSTGIVGCTFSGNIQIDTIISQGCRAIGPEFTVTACHRNVIEELDHQPAFSTFQQMVALLPLHDQNLLNNFGPPQIGRKVTGVTGSLNRGDFLIRAIVGVRRDLNQILIGDVLSEGDIVRFYVRDAQTADEELRLLLEGETLLGADPLGAMLFSGTSRGTRLFPQPNHDVSIARNVLGKIPIAGFFAAGEIGPVGGRSFIHGHTAALALFRKIEE